MHTNLRHRSKYFGVMEQEEEKKLVLYSYSKILPSHRATTPIAAGWKETKDIIGLLGHCTGAKAVIEAFLVDLLITILSGQSERKLISTS